jgi:translation initiation factor IF-2
MTAERVAELVGALEAEGLNVVAISAATGQGIPQLLERVWQLVHTSAED